MSLDAIRIVREEIAKRKASTPDIHCAHARLDTLEEKITHRIHDELVELAESTIQEKYPSLHGEDYPSCHYCTMDAEYEGWIGTGHVIRVFVCDEHKSKLRGAENHG